MSSIRAQTGPVAAQVLTESSLAHPTDSYGRSKLAAEDAIRGSGVSFTILRPVLIYGEGVKGNLESLMELSRSRWPLPFGLFRNRRSLLSRQNLIAAIKFSLESPSMSGETYIVADPAPVTLSEIVAALRRGLGRRPALLPVPQSLFGIALKAAGRTEIWDRLGGKLVVDPSKLLAAGWKPTIETVTGLAAMAQSSAALKSGTAVRRTP
jgi:UDP-glucose 4-epimerase